MKVHVPEAASTLLLQEEKFKFYFAQLSELVRIHTAEVCMHGCMVSRLIVCSSQACNRSLPAELL
jgi:hypothetical protein